MLGTDRQARYKSPENGTAGITEAQGMTVVTEATETTGAIKDTKVTQTQETAEDVFGNEGDDQREKRQEVGYCGFQEKRSD